MNKVKEWAKKSETTLVLTNKFRDLWGTVHVEFLRERRTYIGVG